MTNKKRALLISCAIILLCLAIIAGMTYSLFTESITVKNHLQAGDLNITLTRTNLKYEVLDADGYLAYTELKDAVELTDTTTGDLSIFGVDSTNMRIAPGAYFEATLQISNPGEVAFLYSVDFVLSGKASDLADQLEVTITDSNGDKVIKSLSEFTVNDSYLTANLIEMKANNRAEPDVFTIRIEFVDDVEYNQNVDLDAGETFMDNDLAQTDIATFDLIVTATQQSKPGTTTP